MPRLLKPGAKVPVVLRSDQDEPADRQPTFYAKLLNGHEWGDVVEKYDSLFADTGDSSKELTKRRYSIAREVIVGWENMIDPKAGKAIPFDGDQLELIIDPFECVELIEAAITAGRLSYEDKKKSESQASSSTDNSAPIAPKVDASIAPAPESLPKFGVPPVKNGAAMTAAGAGS